MMQLKRIGHVLLRVRDLDRSRRFYTAALGFEVMEQDPEHGGLFMALPGHAHTLDLFPAAEPDTAPPPMAGGLGVQHVAFQVDSEEELKDAYFSLMDHGVKIARTVDHVSQKSIYFHDPDKNLLEIVWERPDALEIFAKGRADEDKPLTFSR